MRNVAIFASGNGTNFQAIVDKVKAGSLKINVSVLIVDKKNAYAIQRANNSNVDCFYVNPKDFSSKEEYETKIISILNDYHIDLIALAGYMRLIGTLLLEKYENRIINIHPSLLPAFKGKDAIGQAFNYGVKVMGVTVHYVDNGMDTGKIIAQESFNVMPLDTLEDVEKNIHAIEHRMYPEVLRKLLEE